MSGIPRGRLRVATAASKWVGGRLRGYDAMLAPGLAVLVGLLTLLASTEAQYAIPTWIRHRAETGITAEPYRIRRRIRTACGLRWTLAGAR